ncbi:MAG: hypothetical protein HY293_15445 [Planctomycetes bacterium]|nr:hypothetical protein [Planctomycetota bacterium]
MKDDVASRPCPAALLLVLAAAAAALAVYFLRSTAFPREITGSNTLWEVSVHLEEPDQHRAYEPALLVIQIRNRSDRPIRIDPLSLQSSSIEMEITRPSGARENVRSGLGPHLRSDAGVEIQSGRCVSYNEAFIPDEGGSWTAALAVRITPQDLNRESTLVRLPPLRFRIYDQAAAAVHLIRAEQLERLLLGQEKFLDSGPDGPKLDRLEAVASARLRRSLALARGMTLALSHRFGYRKEDEDAIRLLENYAALQPRPPLTDVALLGLAKIYSESRPFQSAGGDPERDARELRRVADRMRREFPTSSITLGELPYYDQ